VFSFDIVVLDIMMPGESGYEFLEGFRQSNSTPVLFLSAMGDVDDRVKGLELGADDFLPKPFEPRELVLRINMILKRTRTSSGVRGPLKIGRWTYNAEEKVLVTQDESIRLTEGENNLLSALASKQGDVISREELAELCFLDAGERTIDVQVTRLRRKLEEDPKAPVYLQTVRGKGYVLKGGV
jgi:two-component system phosphate regulon response regulator OmpR